VSRSTGGRFWLIIVIVSTSWLAALLIAMPNGVSASVRSPVDAGGVLLVDPDTGSPLSSGDSNSVFTLALPPDASCPGDSANDDWRVQTFLVPANDDPGSLRYGIIRADGDGRFAIYTVDTQPYVHALTGQNPAPGMPGMIRRIPPLSFAVFPAGTLEMQSYRIGVACTLYRETAKYWDAEIVLAAAPEVQPGEFRWQVVGAQPIHGDDNAPSIVLLIVALAAGAVVAVTVVIRKRRARAQLEPSDRTIKEPV
jgi:hypothetical protein